MEGVGARLGRSSTRYGPVTVFTGPVRKWKKKWVHVSPSNTGGGGGNNNNHSQNHHSNGNGTSNGNNGPHLVLFKWTPITQSQNNNKYTNNSPKEDTVAAPEEPPRRKFKYIPIAVIEEQKREAAENEAAENVDDEDKPSESDPSVAEPTSRTDGFDEKPDINDVPMEENEEDDKMLRQDLNESTLDLSLGLTAHDGESDLKPNRHGQLERVKSSSR
ncbi:putative serine/threonine-protein kinase isoform X1 [Gossypium australe]|uniref:Putative serine/threonine-protein kinase isoform X1 n=1 Tax=Gossypium australe TaxID=47621 RepID=A0A5B6WBP7_9ROSI|nr:putative serine/threonine-protein kinase isoform X1 [Gossypium australe]